MRHAALGLFVLLVVAGATPAVVQAQAWTPGQIADDIQCEDDRSQRYALYVPSTFTPARTWPLILLFDAGGRGRRGVERYQAAAEQYGFIVAGSNNSRNGPWQVAIDAARAMTADVRKRLPIDSNRVYTGGMSGGARVAMLLALTPSLLGGPLAPEIAGVLASSAGFPPDDFRESVRFVIFGTAGTEDFNYQEMRELDRRVTTPHRIEVFEGGHTWLPEALATNGIEWIEIQAMKQGRRPRDDRLIQAIFAKRMGRVDAAPGDATKLAELASIAADFDGLTDVGAVRARVAALERRPDVQRALKTERDADAREADATRQVFDLLARLNEAGGFARLKERVERLAVQASGPTSSVDRSIARRVLSNFTASARTVPHPELQALLTRIRPAPQPAAPQ